MDKKDKIKISYSPGKIEFKTKNKTEIRYIFSLEQYYKTLDYFGIKFPWSKDMVLSKKNINTIIYDSNYLERPVIIEDITIFDINLSEEKKNYSKYEYEIDYRNLNKFRDLSEFVLYYLMEDLEIKKYEEKDFINQEEFMIKADSKLEIYNYYERIFFKIICSSSDKKDIFSQGKVQ